MTSKTIRLIGIMLLAFAVPPVLSVRNVSPVPLETKIAIIVILVVSWSFIIYAHFKGKKEVEDVKE